MSTIEKQATPIASVWMIENNAPFADFLLLKEHI